MRGFLKFKTGNIIQCIYKDFLFILFENIIILNLNIHPILIPIDNGIKTK